MNAITCRRCGASAPRRHLDQRYCVRCELDVAQRELKAVPSGFQPPWRARLTAKDFTGRAA